MPSNATSCSSITGRPLQASRSESTTAIWRYDLRRAQPARDVGAPRSDDAGRCEPTDAASGRLGRTTPDHGVNACAQPPPNVGLRGVDLAVPNDEELNRIDRRVAAPRPSPAPTPGPR